MKLYLLRHAQAVSHGTNPSLSSKGQRDSRVIAFSLKRIKIDAIVVSPLKRTLETIKPYVHEHRSVELIEHPLTTERNLGRFRGTPTGTFEKHCQREKLNQIHHIPPGGESLAQVHHRAKLFLQYLEREFVGKNVVVCGHKDFLKCLLIATDKNKEVDYFYEYSHIRPGEVREV